MEVAAAIGGQTVAFIEAEGRSSAAITLAVDGVVISGSEAIVGYLLDAGGISIALAAPTVQHWLGWRATAAANGADATAVGKALASGIAGSGFLAGSAALTSADIVVAAWAAGTTGWMAKLPKAVAAWIVSTIGDAPVATTAAAKPGKGRGGGGAAAAAAAAAPAAPVS